MRIEIPTLCVNSGINLCQRFEIARLHIDGLVGKCDRDNDAGEIEDVDCSGISVVFELVMSNGGSAGDRGDDSIKLSSGARLEFSDPSEIFHLVIPLLELDIPHFVEIGLLHVRINERGNVGN